MVIAHKLGLILWFKIQIRHSPWHDVQWESSCVSDESIAIKKPMTIMLIITSSFSSLILAAMTTIAAAPIMASSATTAFVISPRKPPVLPHHHAYNKKKLHIVSRRALDEQHDYLLSKQEQEEEQLLLNRRKSLRETLNVHDNLCNVYAHPLIVGHRGCLYDELENTRESFASAAKMGAHAVELDVFWLPKCHTLVVFHGSGNDDAHPGKLDGYSSTLQGSILNYTYKELQDGMRFNVDYQEFQCPREKIETGQIPTLQDVLKDARQTGVLVKIELKGPQTAVPVLELVESLDMQHQCHYSSFDLTQIATIRQLRPQVNHDGKHIYKTGALFSQDIPDNYIQLALDAGASEAHLLYDTCTTDRINEIHLAGMDSMAWFRGPVGMKRDSQHKYWDVGNEDTSMYRTVLQTGVRQLCVNRPDVLAQMLS